MVYMEDYNALWSFTFKDSMIREVFKWSGSIASQAPLGIEVQGRNNLTLHYQKNTYLNIFTCNIISILSLNELSLSLPAGTNLLLLWKAKCWQLFDELTQSPRGAYAENQHVSLFTHHCTLLCEMSSSLS